MTALYRAPSILPQQFAAAKQQSHKILPGPGQYDVRISAPHLSDIVRISTQGSGAPRFGKGQVKSDLDWIIRAAKQKPSPQGQFFHFLSFLVADTLCTNRLWKHVCDSISLPKLVFEYHGQWKAGFSRMTEN